MLSHDEQVIIAQCTPKGAGALALLRISGIHALDIAEQIAKLPSEKKSPRNQRILYIMAR